MQRSIEQWRKCDPETMATKQSREAIFYAFRDAKADILRLHAQRDELLTALEIIASGNTDPDRMVEIASAAIAKANGQEGSAA